MLPNYMFESPGKCFNHLGNLTNFVFFFIKTQNTFKSHTHTFMFSYYCFTALPFCYSQLAHCIVLERFEKQDVRRLKSYKLLSPFFPSA